MELVEKLRACSVRLFFCKENTRSRNRNPGKNRYLEAGPFVS